MQEYKIHKHARIYSDVAILGSKIFEKYYSGRQL